jgi:hypothetical protein
MTLYKPTLQINRLGVFKSGKTVYDQKFHPGVNIIRGANSTGKSTIADFIFYVLGGDITKWKPEAAGCEFVIAEVKMNEALVTLRRKISEHRNQPMDIFWGPMEAGLASAVEGWEIYPFRRSSEKESLSQVLFRALALPEVRSDTDSNITMHQLLRLLFVDQMSPPDCLFIQEQFDSPFTRKTIFDLLVGLFDDTLYSDELKLRLARQKAEETKTRIDALLGAMTDLEQEVDQTVLQQQIAEKQEQLLRINTHLQQLASQPTVTAEPAADNTAQLQRDFEALRRERTALAQELARIEVEVGDSEQFIAELTKRSQALNESVAMRNILGTLEIQFCPQCLQPLDTAHGEQSCKLCGQQLPADASASQRLRLQQELAMQIRESSALLDGKRTKLQQLQARLPSIRRATEQAERQLKEALSRVTSQRNQELDELYQKRGSLESEVGYLLKFHKAAATFSALRESAGRLAAEIRELELRIEAKRRTQLQRRSLADAHISDNAVHLLRADLPSEEHFEVAQKVTVDIGVNSFAVDGRNQFSASSVTFLKNAVHFAFLFSSLELEFFRYPRLIICDNIEDKGMVPARSQNLQRLIVQRSGTFDVEHQIIFTTSMIAPELNNPTYCVGEEYTHENKSLKI